MNKDELIELIESLKIDKNEFWILSSGALVLRDIFPDAGDLDIAVTEKGLDELKSNYNLKQKENGWYIVNDKVECVLDTKTDWKFENFNGYNIQSIFVYYEYLLNSNREKDKLRIPLIEKYMKENNIKLKQVLFATSNPAKLKRFSNGLLKRGIELLSLKDIDVEIDVEENGKDAIENALIKARAYYKETRIPTIGMDDNLYLENVPDNKQPGMYVRRVGGKTLNDEEMIEHYLNLVKQYGTGGKITARWVYGMAIINNEKENTFTWSKEDFYLVDKPSNIVQKGYPLNTISVNKKLNKYFTEITEEDKILIKEDESEVVDFICNNVK